MFNFDPNDHSSCLRKFDYLHIPGGCGENFLHKLEDFVKKIESNDPPETFSFLPQGDDHNAILKTFQILIGNDDLTISRHHILHYRKEMPSYPHKDRRSLEYSCAIGIRSTIDSRLLLWPSAPLNENMGAHWRDHVVAMGGQSEIERATRDNRPIEIATERGDVVFFPSSRMYHERTNPEGVMIYYIAINTYGIYDRSASRQERADPGDAAPPPPQHILT